MLNKITVTSYTGDSISLYPGQPWITGIEVGDIDGLGPESATINTTDLSTSDGSLYNSSRIDKREINFKFYPMDYGENTIEQTRLEIYRYFPLKRKVNIKFYEDSREAEIDGYVSRIEPTIYNKLESIKVTVTCPDPYFYSIENKDIYNQEVKLVNGVTTTVFAGVLPLFEFPFENDSLTEPLLEMGQIVQDARKNVYYTGELALGFTINIHFLGGVSGFKFYDVESHDVIAIDDTKFRAITGSGFQAGDDIIISTVKGNKYVYLLRKGMYTNILNAIDRNVTWFELNKGDNLFVFTVDKGLEYVQLSVINRTAYAGI